MSSFKPFFSSGPAPDGVGVTLFGGGGVAALIDSIGAGIGTSDNGLLLREDLLDSGVFERRGESTFATSTAGGGVGDAGIGVGDLDFGGGGVGDFDFDGGGGVGDFAFGGAAAARGSGLLLISAFFCSKAMLGIGHVGAELSWPRVAVFMLRAK